MGEPGFSGDFERMLELSEVMHMIASADPPWEMGHGGLLKNVLEKAEGTATLGHRNDLEIALAQATSQKRRMLQSGGVSPSQLVVGVNPWIAAELMSYHTFQEFGAREHAEPSGDHDIAAAETSGMFGETLFSGEDTSKLLRTAAVQGVHKDWTFTQGQRVYAWRR